MPEGARPFDDRTGEPGAWKGAIHSDAGVVEDPLEGEGRAEAGFFDDALILQSRIHRRANEEQGDDDDPGEDLFAIEPADGSEEEDRSGRARDDEEEKEHDEGLRKEVGRDPSHPGEGEEKRGEDKGEAPARKRGRFEAFPQKEGPVRDGQGEEPAGIAAAVERDVRSHRNGEEQHQEKAEKEHVDEPVAKESACRRERGDVAEALAEEPVGGDHVANEKGGDRPAHEPRMDRRVGRLHPQHPPVDAE